MRRGYLANGKPVDLRDHRTVAELAEYVGVSTRTVERWASNGTIPEPAAVSDQGWKLWSPEQCGEILHSEIERRIK